MGIVLDFASMIVSLIGLIWSFRNTIQTEKAICQLQKKFSNYLTQLIN